MEFTSKYRSTVRYFDVNNPKPPRIMSSAPHKNYIRSQVEQSGEPLPENIIDFLSLFLINARNLHSRFER